MTILDPQPSTLFPDLPRAAKIADKDGNINPDWSAGLAAIFQSLQKSFSNEGFKIPPLTDTQIAAIQSIYTPLIGGPLPFNVPDISGAMIFDSTNRVPKMYIITYDGATPPNIVTASWKTFTLT